MLTSIHVSSFKCFEKLDLPLSPLTLLSGVNGGGKSSIIQALVLLTQTLLELEWGRTLLLEGRELALGSVSDVVSQTSAGRRLALGASTRNESVVWTFGAEEKRALSMRLDEVRIDGRVVELGRSVRWLLPEERAEGSAVVAALRQLSWITAERIGPRELLPLRDAHGHRRVGAQGEFAAGLLYWRESEAVRPELCLPELPRTLLHQVRARMHEFFPGCDLRVSPIEGTNTVSLRLRSDPRSEFQRPQNVGFGLTQLFPIVVALLAAERGDIVVVENPEVHLHPQAQQRIGMLLARVAASGTQVIIETHSDHVLNGVRLAVKARMIEPSHVGLHFLGPDDPSFQPKSPTLDSDGRLDDWPKGFFDQFDVALSELL